MHPPDVFEGDRSQWLSGQAPPPFVRQPSDSFFATAYMLSGPFSAMHWVSDRRFGFTLFPGPATRRRSVRPNPLTDPSDGDSDSSSDLNSYEPERPHIEYLQEHCLGFFFAAPICLAPSALDYPHPPSWIIPSHAAVLFGPLHQHHSHPFSWQFPVVPNPTDGQPSTFCEHHLTLAIWHCFRRININPSHLRNYFCLVPDPLGSGPLTFSHPIMRRIAAIAYCVHYPSAHGILYDVDRECGRSRAMQAFYTFEGPGNCAEHVSNSNRDFLGAETQALAPDSSSAISRHWPELINRVLVRLFVASYWAGRIDHPDTTQANIPEILASTQYVDVRPEPLLCPWRTRTAPLGWDTDGVVEGMSPLQLQWERTAWTQRACDGLLLWSRQRPGPVLI